MTISRVGWQPISAEKVFIISTMVVNGGNYFYNLVLGRLLSPSEFSEAGLIITLLLVFSFLAMTFQVVAAKFSIEFDGRQLEAFKKWITSTSLKTGLAFAVLFLVCHSYVTNYFHLTGSWVVPVFSMALPLYFLMSVRRGFLQGSENYVSLSISYQSEMWVRLIISLVLIVVFNSNFSLWISVAIVASVLVGYIVISHDPSKPRAVDSFDQKKIILRFFLLTAGYECSQILINYSDILLVKHYFDSHQAGLYTSMALIGRMIYFVTWMVVMTLIPKVIKLRKSGGAHKQPLIKYAAGILVLSATITLMAFLFPNLIVVSFFGKTYLPIAHLLWVYSLATTLFALANIFVYYFLSIDRYVPVYIAIGMGIVQVGLLFVFHTSLAQIIWVQVINMAVLLSIQLLYFLGKD